MADPKPPTHELMRELVSENVEPFRQPQYLSYIAAAEQTKRELIALSAHFAAAAPEHNLPALLDLYFERQRAAEKERDELKAKLESGQLQFNEYAAADPKAPTHEHMRLRAGSYMHGPPGTITYSVGEELLAYIAAAERAERENARLLRVAVEAIRLVHGSELGDHYSHEPCGECGLGGAGAIRDALKDALGPGYTKLVWGKGMNADWDALREAAAKAASEALK